ncbi:MAG TPA: CYTH domain-containing protein, partial [Casimicrobiaceae bacterium]|nr:CYTH domain-containing protein [Casimicrobiaceae bacterium]
MTGGVEVELKLRVPPAAVPKLRSHPALAAHRHGPVRRERLAATYFDTPDLRLAAQGIALRVRRERGRWVQTIKTAGTTAGGLARRDEHEWDLGRASRPPAPDLARLAASPVGPAFARAAGGRPIEPCFVTEFQRTSVPLAFPDGTRALAAIDTGRVYVPGREAEALPLSELELELETGDVARLFELALAFADDVPLAAETRSKAQRG